VDRLGIAGAEAGEQGERQMGIGEPYPARLALQSAVPAHGRRLELLRLDLREELEIVEQIDQGGVPQLAQRDLGGPEVLRPDRPAEAAVR
jgi:hypothetical protein